MKPFLVGLSPTLHISHRGGSAVAPENTLVAFRQAVSVHRTDMLELDVHATSDGELVVAHDDVVDRCTDGEGPIAAKSLADVCRLDAGFRFTADGRSFPFRGLGVRIPRFVDVLREFPKLRVNCELKPSAGAHAALLASVLRSEHAVDRVCVGSEDDGVAAKVHEVLPEACHFYPRDALTALVLSARMGEELSDDARYTVLDMPLFYEGMKLIDRPFIDRMTAAGKWVNVWTIDDESVMRELVSDGVGGIMTDRPDTLRRVLG